MPKTELDILVEDAIFHRLTIQEGIEYIETRTKSVKIEVINQVETEIEIPGVKISASTFKRRTPTTAGRS